MPRNAWAKVYCDLLRHPKITGRPDSDKVLWLGLILYAKEHAPDTGLIEGLGPDDLRGHFGIKAPVQKVADGLDYMVRVGLLVREGDGIRIRDFATRQKDDSSAARTKAWRARHGDGQEPSHASSHPSHAPSSVTTEVEGEVEEERKEKAVSAQSHEGRTVNNGEKPQPSALNTTKKNEVLKALAAGDGTKAIALLAVDNPLRKSQETP